MFSSLRELVEALNRRIPEALDFWRGVDRGELPEPSWWPIPTSAANLAEGLQRGSVPATRYYQQVTTGLRPPPAWWPSPTQMGPTRPMGEQYANLQESLDIMRGMPGGDVAAARLDPEAPELPSLLDFGRLSQQVTPGPSQFPVLRPYLGPAGPGAPVSRTPLPFPNPAPVRTTLSESDIINQRVSPEVLAERQSLGFPRPVTESASPFGPIRRDPLPFEPRREGNYVPPFDTGASGPYPAFWTPDIPREPVARIIDVPSERIGSPLGPPVSWGFPGYERLPVAKPEPSAIRGQVPNVMDQPTPQKSSLDLLLERLQRVSSQMAVREGRVAVPGETGSEQMRRQLVRMATSDDINSRNQASAFLIMNLKARLEKVSTKEQFLAVIDEITNYRSLGTRQSVYGVQGQVINETAEGASEIISGPAQILGGQSGFSESGTYLGSRAEGLFNLDLVSRDGTTLTDAIFAAALRLDFDEDIIKAGRPWLASKTEGVPKSGERPIWDIYGDEARTAQDAVLPSNRVVYQGLLEQATRARGILDANSVYDELAAARARKYETPIGALSPDMPRTAPEINDIDAVRIRREAERAHNAEVTRLLQTVGKQYTAPDLAAEVATIVDDGIPYVIGGQTFAGKAAGYSAAISIAETPNEVDRILKIIEDDIGLSTMMSNAAIRQKFRLSALTGPEGELAVQRMFGGTEWVRGTNRAPGAPGVGASREVLIGESEKAPLANPMGIAILDSIRAKRTGQSFNAIFGGRLAGKRSTGFLPTAEEIEELDIYSRLSKPGETAFGDKEIASQVQQITDEIDAAKLELDELMEMGFDVNSPEADEILSRIADLNAAKSRIMSGGAGEGQGVLENTPILRRLLENLSRSESYPTLEGRESSGRNVASLILKRMASAEGQRTLAIEQKFARDVSETIASWVKRLEETPRGPRSAGTAEEQSIFGPQVVGTADYRIGDQGSAVGSDTEAHFRWLKGEQYREGVPRAQDFHTREEFMEITEELQRMEESGRVSDSMLREITDEVERHARKVMGSPTWDSRPPKPAIELGRPVESKQVGPVEVSDIQPNMTGYRARTIANASSADVTISIADDFFTGGETLTRRAAVAAGTDFLPVWLLDGDIEKAAQWLNARLYRVWLNNGRRPITINGAGNSLEAIGTDITQEMYNNYTARLFDLIASMRPGIVGRVITGGQSGGDIAIAVAARRAGIPVTVNPAYVSTKKGPRVLVYDGRGGDGTSLLTKQEYMQRFGLGTQDPFRMSWDESLRGGGGRHTDALTKNYFDEFGIQLSGRTSRNLRELGVETGIQPPKRLDRPRTEAPAINLDNLKVASVPRFRTPGMVEVAPGRTPSRAQEVPGKSLDISPANPNQVLVYGTVMKPKKSGSLKGIGNAANKSWGAEAGVVEGLTGQAYALPLAKVDSKAGRQLADEELRRSLSSLVEEAKLNQDKVFYLVPDGFSWSGYTRADIARVLVELDVPVNIRISGITDADAKRFMDELRKAFDARAARARIDSTKREQITPRTKSGKALEVGELSLDDPSQVFVFGSNLQGIHGAGAARTARQAWGAEQGVGRGLTGRSYALPTKSDPKTSLNISQVEKEFDELHKVVTANPDKTFMLSPVGTGLAGFELDEIASIIARFDWPDNIRIVDVDANRAAEFADLIASKKGPAANLPPAKNKTPWAMKFKDSKYLKMRPEFKGKSTMDLILSGNRTATTRADNWRVSVGDVIDFADDQGRVVRVRVTKAPYQLPAATDAIRQRWSDLEGWDPSMYDKYVGQWQFQYELLGQVK